MDSGGLAVVAMVTAHRAFVWEKVAAEYSFGHWPLENPRQFTSQFAFASSVRSVCRRLVVAARLTDRMDPRRIANASRAYSHRLGSRDDSMDERQALAERYATTPKRRAALDISAGFSAL